MELHSSLAVVQKSFSLFIRGEAHKPCGSRIVGNQLDKYRSMRTSWAILRLLVAVGFVFVMITVSQADDLFHTGSCPNTSSRETISFGLPHTSAFGSNRNSSQQYINGVPKRCGSCPNSTAVSYRLLAENLPQMEMMLKQLEAIPHYTGYPLISEAAFCLRASIANINRDTKTQQ